MLKGKGKITNTKNLSHQRVFQSVEALFVK